jgi:heme exporter protein C
MVFATIMLTTGPLWGAVAWNTAWNWEPRLVLTLLLWFIFLGYFLVRGATDDPEKGKRFAAVIAIVGAMDIPLIHISVSEWFRNRFPTLHPTPVVLNQDEGPTLDGDMLTLLLLSLTTFTAIFLGLFLLRYALETFRSRLELRERRAT